MSTSTKRHAVIITAAGTGTRFSSTQAKALAPLDGKPLIAHSIQALLSLKPVQFIITVHPDTQAEIQAVASQYSDAIQSVLGGATRAESVKAGVDALEDGVDRVWIHDAARPFLAADLIQRLQDASELHRAVIPGIAVTDTIKLLEDGIVRKTIDRDQLSAAQTPQVFDPELLRDAYQRGGIEAGTDESSLIEEVHKVRVIAGCLENQKVTYTSDLPG